MGMMAGNKSDQIRLGSLILDIGVYVMDVRVVAPFGLIQG